MSAEIGGKLWLLQNEQAVQSLAKHPTWAVGTVASLYHLPKADLQTWLDLHNGGDRKLEPTRIQQVKRELGILSEGKQDRTADSAPNPAPRQAPVQPKAAAPAKAAAERPAKYARPWLGKRWRGDGFSHWRPVLVLLAAKPDLGFAEAAGSAADAASLRQFKYTWFGAGDLSSAQVQEFIEYGDARANPSNTAPRVVEKPAVAAVPAAAVKQPPAAAEPPAGSAAPMVPPPAVVKKPAAVEDGILLRFEITVRLVPEGEGAR